MPAEPKLKPLSYNNRTLVFILMCTIFLILMPIFVFYATGYRIDFDGDERNIVSVGGIYINSEQDGVEILVDGKPVERMRIFRSAAYIQNLVSGIHKVRVQAEGLTTWVKPLPVHEFLVTEASAFTLPATPQIRVVPHYIDNNGFGLVLTDIKNATTSQALFPHASTTTLVLATSSATVSKTLEVSPEYEYVDSLFSSSTQRVYQQSLAERVAFRFSDLTNPDDSTELSASTKELHNVVLYEDDGEVYARWVGDPNRTPYYYCVNYLNDQDLINDYGEHVYAALYEDFSQELVKAKETPGYDKICRSKIRIDRKQQEVKWFDFLPNANHLVLMLLEDGLYVVEVDDRGWQNVQLLYPGNNLEFVVAGSQIYVYDGEYYLELFTEIAS